MRVARSVKKVSHGFLSGQAVYLNPEGEWTLAKADSEFTLGIAIVERIDKNNFNVIFSGLIYNLFSLNKVGEYYFVSDAVAGQLTPIEPTSPASFSNPLLFLTSKNTGIVLNLRPESLSLPEVKFETQATYPIKVDATTISLNPDNSTHGDLLFRNASRWDRLPAGSQGQVLMSNGSGATPSWEYSSYKSYITIQVGRSATTYSPATSYYIGSLQNVDNRLMQNATIQKIKSPANARVVKINHIVCADSGSGETCTFKLQNVTKSTFSQSWSMPINYTSGANNLINLNLEVSEGDDLLLIMETPSTWSSAPTQVQQSFIIYLEPHFENSNYILNP